VRRRFYFQAKARSQVDAQHDSAMEEEREEREYLACGSSAKRA
jgi:hypothetical protein